MEKCLSAEHKDPTFIEHYWKRPVLAFMFQLLNHLQLWMDIKENVWEKAKNTDAFDSGKLRRKTS